MKKKGAIELSIGTIVILVLAMSMLVLGMILIKNIFTGATGIAKMNEDQIKNQISKMFGEDNKLVIYPDTRHIKIKSGEVDGFGFGIQNLNKGSNPETKFSYEVIVSDPDIRTKCGVTEREAEGWITTGRAEDGLEISPGDSMNEGRVLIEVPEGSSLCTFRYRLNVRAGGKTYASDLMDVTIKA